MLWNQPRARWRMLDYSGTPESVRTLMYRGEGVHSHSHVSEGDQYKFLGVLESVRQEERLSLDCAAGEFLIRMSVILSSPVFDHNRETASNQFALPVLGYLMWTQQWPVPNLERLHREARKIFVENRGKQPCGSTAILYMPREKRGNGCDRLRRSTR